MTIVLGQLGLLWVDSNLLGSHDYCICADTTLNYIIFRDEGGFYDVL